MIRYHSPVTSTAGTKKAAQKRAVLYLRISQDRSGEGETVERHEKECRAVGRRLGAKIVHVFVDNDTPASTGKPREAYEQMLTWIEAGRVDIVIAWHNDRLHRRPTELERYIDVCQPKNVATHFALAVPLDLTTASGRLMARQHGIMARYETEHMIERLKSQQAEAATEGRWMGGTRPFGWGVPVGTFRKNGTPIYDMYKIVPAEAKEVRRLTRAVLEGKSLGSLVKDLNERGVQTTGSYPRRKDGTRPEGHPPWSYATLRQVLMRKRNIGLLEYNGDTFKGRWPAIVDEDEYWAVCEILTDPTRRKSLSTTAKWLGSGIYRCGREGCGRPLKSAYVRSRDGGSRRLYRCDARYRPAHPAERGQTSGHVHRNAEPIDALIGGGVINDEKTVGAVVLRLQQPDVEELLRPDPVPGVDVEALKAERAVLRNRLLEADDMWGSGQWDRARHERQTKRIQSRLDEIGDLLQPRAVPEPLELLVRSSDKARAWKRLPLDAKRQVIDQLMVVTVMPIGRGWHSRIFDPASVAIDFK